MTRCPRGGVIKGLKSRGKRASRFNRNPKEPNTFPTPAIRKVYEGLWERELNRQRKGRALRLASSARRTNFGDEFASEPFDHRRHRTGGWLMSRLLDRRLDGSAAQHEARLCRCDDCLQTQRPPSALPGRAGRADCRWCRSPMREANGFRGARCSWYALPVLDVSAQRLKSCHSVKLRDRKPCSTDWLKSPN